tara:strand:+ start:94 stop:402 length:309 start_codon:yes stop_codon:yes gene_type:complete
LSDIHCGEIWRVKAQLGFRYVLVVSPDSMNAALTTALTIPITTRLKSWPTRMPIKFKKGVRYLLGEQLGSEPIENFESKVGEVNLAEMAKVRILLKQMLVES